MLFGNSHFVIYNKIWKTPREDRTPAQRTLFAIMDFGGEVNNGGLEQYFLNSTGMDAPIIEACLREIGAHASADLAGKAFDVVGGATIDWADHLARKQRIWDLSDAQWDELAEIDVILWDDADPTEQLMDDFVAAHIADFTWVSPRETWPRLRSIRGDLATGAIIETEMIEQPADMHAPNAPDVLD